MSDDSLIFKKALGNMTKEVAYKAAVRHLTEEGYSVSEMTQILSYPVSFEEVQRTAYEHMQKTGIICEDEPDKKSHEKVSYVMDEGAFGKRSYRRIVSKEDETDKEYILCTFGTLSASEKEKILSLLDKKSREYMTGIPWPKKPVYHLATDKFRQMTDEIKKHGFDITKQP
ncbi:MAG: hypothetical protein K6A38_06275 [Lachnospiraceae bacterium]|nr:hypothetical protein [Lachnospiraceae bacterium]